MNDPLIEALARANPASPEQFTNLPPLRLPHRRRRAALATLASLVAAALAAITFAPSPPPAGAEVAGRALAAGPTEILHWRVRVARPQMETYTEELWMHVDAAGRVIAVRELRLDGAYRGEESLTLQPHGLDTLADAVSLSRSAHDAPIKTAHGVGYGDGFASAVQAAQEAARGELDLGRASEATYDGRPAYEVKLRGAIGGQPPIWLWVDRATHAPLAVCWGKGETLWRTETILTFERLPYDPRLTRLGGVG